MMQKPEIELVCQASALLENLAPYVVQQRALCAARDLVRAQRYRAVGPHRAAGNVRRLAQACERARDLLAV